MTEPEIDIVSRALETVISNQSSDTAVDAVLDAITTTEDLLILMEGLYPSIDAARAVYRASRRIDGEANRHARWFLAGAHSLIGLDDIAHAIEPQQQETGFIKKAFVPD